MARSKVRNTARGQFVLLPEAVALPRHVRTVEIIKLGRSRLIVPVNAGWDAFFASPRASEDFMSKRLQPKLDR